VAIETKCSACGVDVLKAEPAICCGATVCPACWDEDRNCAGDERCARLGAYWRREPGAVKPSIEELLLPFAELCCGAGVGRG
jgi:hypothetical protein